MRRPRKQAVVHHSGVVHITWDDGSTSIVQSEVMHARILAALRKRPHETARAVSTEKEDADAELAEPLRRVYVPHTQFRGPCQVCGEQIGFHHQRQDVVAVHMDARSKPMLVGGRWTRARCLGSMRPPG